MADTAANRASSPAQARLIRAINTYRGARGAERRRCIMREMRGMSRSMSSSRRTTRRRRRR